ncbi:MAG: hypothetical protein HKN09_04500, partial [Saprospiraceae bacterium]|nr:hypothetical protein [Saprospiraceae bacterium]
MKRIHLILTIAFLGAFTTLQAQFDDLYYNPSDVIYEEEVYVEDYNYDDEYGYEDPDYANGVYNYWDDYDNYYGTRIRRFNRTYVNLGYYSTFGCNNFFYDPWDIYYNPYGGYRGTNIYFGFSFGPPVWGWNRGWNNWGWNRWNRWDRWHNNWGWNNACVGGWGNNWYGGGYWGNGWAGGGWNNGWNGGGWNNVNVINNNVYATNNPKGTYYGSRRGGSTSSSVKGERPPGRSTGRDITTTNHSLGTIDNNGTIVKEKQIRGKSEPGLAANTSSARVLTNNETSPRLAKRPIGVAENESPSPRGVTKTSPTRNSASGLSSRNTSPNPRRVERSTERPSRRSYANESRSRNTSPNPTRVERSSERPSRRAYGTSSRASERNTSPAPARVERPSTTSTRKSYSNSNSNSNRQQSVRPSSR